MRKFDLPLVADAVFYALAAGVLSFCLMRIADVSLPVSAAVSLLLLLAAGGTVFLLTKRSRDRVFLTRRQAEERAALMLHLALERRERTSAALAAAFRAEGKAVRQAEDELLVDDMPYLARFTMQPLSADEAAALLREYGKQPFVLLCNALTPECERLLAAFGRKTLCGDEVYELFARTQTLPSPLICGEIPRKPFKTRLRAAFRKTNARPFLVSGVLLLLMSLFTFFPVYYLIAGAALVLVSLAVRLFGHSAA